jgi:uncharacterized membrane protein
MKTLIIYIIAVVIFFAIDMLWLGLVARSFYKQKLGFIMSDNVNWLAAVIFYLIYIGGILYFAVMPALKDSAWQLALINGAVLGLLCYATYDLTNMATINKWPLQVVVVDITWGIVLTGGVSALTYLFSARFIKMV